MAAIWSDFLVGRDVHVDQDRGKSNITYLVAVIYRKDHIQSRLIDQIRIQVISS